MNNTLNSEELFKRKEYLEVELKLVEEHVLQKKKERNLLERNIAKSISPYTQSLPSTIASITNVINSKIQEIKYEMDRNMDAFSLLFSSTTTEEFLQEQIALFEDVLHKNLHLLSMGWDCPTTMIKRYLIAKIDFFKSSLEVVQEENKATKIDTELHFIIKQMVSNSLIIGEGSLVTLKFLDDNSTEQFIVEGDYQSVKHGTTAFVQSHQVNVVNGNKYPLLNLQSPLGNAIRHLTPGTTAKYTGPQGDEITVVVEQIQYC